MTPSMDKALHSVHDERTRQDNKWGADRNHTPAEWLMILGEEYGEACEAALALTFPSQITLPENQTSYTIECEDQFRNELVQVAAVAVAMIECLDRKRAGAPVCNAPASLIHGMVVHHDKGLYPAYCILKKGHAGPHRSRKSEWPNENETPQ